MQHIDLNSQHEAIKQFFLSLPVDPEGIIVEIDGRPFAHLVPIPAESNEEGSDNWTKSKSDRRFLLIDRENEGTLTPEEATELADLEQHLQEHVQTVDTQTPASDL